MLSSYKGESVNRLEPMNRLLWAAEFSSPFTDARLLFTAWNKTSLPQYEGEPSRVMLFNTRKEARAWCKAKNEMYGARQDLCRDWRFRPVRVRETVVKV